MFNPRRVTVRAARSVCEPPEQFQQAEKSQASQQRPPVRPRLSDVIAKRHCYSRRVLNIELSTCKVCNEAGSIIRVRACYAHTAGGPLVGHHFAQKGTRRHGESNEETQTSGNQPGTLGASQRLVQHTDYQRLRDSKPGQTEAEDQRCRMGGVIQFRARRSRRAARQAQKDARQTCHEIAAVTLTRLYGLKGESVVCIKSRHPDRRTIRTGRPQRGGNRRRAIAVTERANAPRECGRVNLFVSAIAPRISDRVEAQQPRPPPE